MRKLKAKKEVEETKVEVATSGFRIKFTNIRKEAYPDPLIETDFFKWKVGDILTKGNTVYIITELSRIPLTERQIKLYRDGNIGGSGTNTYIKDRRIKELLDEYEKNGNFGACKIKMNSIVRAGKEVTKPRGTNLIELNNTGTFLNYRSGYYRTDLATLIRSKEFQISRFEYKVQRAKDTLTSHKNIKDTLVKVSKKMNLVTN
jgi:hypothetical protein